VVLVACACGSRSSATQEQTPPDAGSPGDDGGSDGGSDGGVPGDGGVTLGPPISKDGWTFYGQSQGLSADVHDVSADEAGNVYVAGGDAVYAKSAADQSFQRFDWENGGLTRNCDASAATQCPVISVAGGAPGVAAVGFQGMGTDNDNDPDWQLNSGGADMVSFDGHTLARTRHVLIASPPGVICGSPKNPCPASDFTWTHGRRKLRQVYRIVVNHMKGRVQYGDVWMGGTHATFSVLLANASARGWTDLSAPYPAFADAKDVWEHDHPAIIDARGVFLTGEAWALAIDPLTGDPWGANEFRAATKKGYGSGPAEWWVPLWPPYNPADQYHSYLDIWLDSSTNATDPASMDAVSSMSFCDDGTLWFASSLHGLAQRDATTGTISFIDLPGDHGNNAAAIACDPSDNSIWVGLGWGGLARLKAGAWSFPPKGLGPAFAGDPVRSIQIDRWSTPRVVYFAHLQAKGVPGGVTAYAGP
jgi:hypothetical protein